MTLTDAIALRPLQRSDTAALVRLWNTAFAPPFRIDEAVWEHCTWRAPGFLADDAAVAWADGTPVGLAVTKLWRLEPTPGMSHDMGHLSALAVHPDYRRQGLGGRLLRWAETRLKDQGAQCVLLGREIQPFFCGVPDLTHALPFFTAHGYAVSGMVYDTMRDLAGYTPHPDAVATRARFGERLDLRPATAVDVPDVTGFMDLTFPGRWSFEIGHFLAQGGPPEDIALLRLDGEVQGFAHLHSPGTTHLAYGTNWRLALTPPAGGLGPIGVSRAVRGEGLGLALLDAGLQILAERGTRGCVIDWTTLVDFYGKVGFQPWLTYHQAARDL